MSAFLVDDITINRIASYIDEHYAAAAFKALRPRWQLKDGPRILAEALRLVNRASLRARYGCGATCGCSDEDTAMCMTAFKFSRLNPVISDEEFVYTTECWLYQCAEGDIPDNNPLYAAIQEAKEAIKADKRFDKTAYDAVKHGEFWR